MAEAPAQVDVCEGDDFDLGDEVVAAEGSDDDVSQPHDDGQRPTRASGAAAALSYVEDDTTVPMLGGGHFIVAVLPRELAGGPSAGSGGDRDALPLQWLVLPHPRHGQDALWAVSPSQSPPYGPSLWAAEQWQPPYGTWLLDDVVEPRGAAVILTRFDETFFALSLLCRSMLRTARGGGPATVIQEEITAQCAQPPSSNAAYRTLDDLCTAWEEMRPLARTSFSESLERLCDTTNVDGEVYYRFSWRKSAEWVQAKVTSVLSSPALTEAVHGREYANTTPTDMTAFRRKAFTLVMDVVPPELHAPLAERCGVGDKSADAAGHTTTTGSAQLTGPGEPVLKKPRTEPAKSGADGAKSANVKRLEKAGPPKGTPTLSAFFKPRPPPPT